MMLITDKLKNAEYFSEIDKKIAAFILGRNERIETETVRSIAKAVYVSPATIIRFCYRLGYSGYESFKQNYLQECTYFATHFQNVNPNFPFNANDSSKMIANKMATLYRETVDDTLSLMNCNVIEKTVKILHKVDAIYMFSAGVQIGICELFKDKMIKIGKPTIVSNVIEDLFYSACFVSQNTVFILVSYSGETKNVVDVAKKLKERRIPIIAITSFGNNTLSKYADYCLYISTREKMIAKIGDYAINISILFQLDMIYSAYFCLNYQSNYKNRLHNIKIFEKDRGKTKSSIHNSILLDDEMSD